MSLEFRVLGPLEVRLDGHQLPFRSGKQRVLLAGLLMRAPRVVTIDELVDWLWDDAPAARPRDTLYQYVTRLRQALGSQAIRTAPGGYAVIIDPERLDLTRFEALVARGRELAAGKDLAGEWTVLGDALSLWRGPALMDVGSDTLRRAEADRLDEQRMQAVERRAEVGLRLGRQDEMLGDLTELTRQHPLRERLWHRLILTLAASGRQADALDAYQAVRRLLGDELDVEPGRELRDVHKAIVAGKLRPVPSATTSLRPHLQPAQLPSDIGDFVGRAEQLATLSSQLLPATGSAVPVSVVCGQAGVGKTALAVHTAHRLGDRFPDGQLYVDLHGSRPSEVLGRFLRDLGVDHAIIPDDLEQRAAMYRTLLADRRILVVLDDATGEAQVQPLLPGSSTCAALITSRARLTGLAGVHLVELDVLEPDEAVELLARIAGTERVVSEPIEAARLVGLCDRLPLAIRVAAARLAAKPHWTLGHLAARLADKRSRLDELAHHGLDVRAAIASTLVRLDASAQRLFRRLGLLDTPAFAAWAGAAATGLSVSQAEALMEQLVDAHLLCVTGRGYRFPDLVRLYARELAGTDQAPAALSRAAGA